MRFKYSLVSILLILFTTLIYAEDITQTQKNVECDQSYEFTTPVNLTQDQNTTVNVSIPESTWYIHRFQFIPDFSGEISVEFSGGSDTTSWWLGDSCNSHSYFQADNIPAHTQTIQVTAGVSVTGTIYDWYQASDITLKFSRGNNSNTDTQKPLISLEGDATVALVVGDTYIDAGATASDNVDGDITANIVTISMVNTAIAGSYTVKYNVSDTAGNDADEVTRTVIVNAATGDTIKPVITLTEQIHNNL